MGEAEYLIIRLNYSTVPRAQSLMLCGTARVARRVRAAAMWRAAPCSEILRWPGKSASMLLVFKDE